jgi:hypothetical protein
MCAYVLASTALRTLASIILFMMVVMKMIMIVIKRGESSGSEATFMKVAVF